MVMAAFISATLMLLGSGLPGFFCGRTSPRGERLAAGFLITGALLGAGAVAAALLAPATPAIQLPWPIPGGAFSLTIDGISACFLLPVYLVSAAGAVYTLGYWPQRSNPLSGIRLRFFYGWMAGALTLVLTASNGILFLVSWEIMALTGFFLITTDDRGLEIRRAGFIYLACTHAGTLALLALFALLGQFSGSFDFPPVGSLPDAAAPATAIFLLALFGFGLKAGLMPLHIWLPGAHAAAPSQVSALLSGVMIKTGIYGLIRVTGFFDIPPIWWGWTILALGAISGVMGVAFAIAQHDIKRLLAYHSVENIGIIALGLGTALLGKSCGQPLLTTLGLAGALLHVINHGLFKSLLFLGAGSLIHATGSREIDHYGGLLQRQPLTGLCFLGGAVAICGLPPLNGFVSEWFIYLGLFKSLGHDAPALRLAVFAAPVLALIGGLALACFVKVFGAAFLGSPRTPAAASAHEAPASMLLPMAVLLACCALIGLFPAAAVPLLDRALAAWSAETGPLPSLSTAVAPVAGISGAALALALLLGTLALWISRRKTTQTPHLPTWGCGYAFPAARMQYTASSFAEMLVGLLRWGLRPERHGGRVEELLAKPAELATHTPDTVLDRGVVPACRFAIRICTWLRARVQNGHTGCYLLYVALVLGALLTLATLLRG
ncbi:proton-conducting transporter transmembrane domain-containing protein [Trichloromonas sp.]|uniref:proton-conducting transporter transmembrane domain-containing protein n=1 Tax=Trichloromonas sp. TaxID=3069249 RepID=UPI003D813410